MKTENLDHVICGIKLLSNQVESNNGSSNVMKKEESKMDGKIS